MGQLVFFPLCTFDILLNCFTVHTNLLRLHSSIHRNILQIFVADTWVFFRRQIDREKFALNGSILFKRLYVAIPRLYVPVLCQFRKEGCYFSYFDIFSAFHQLWWTHSGRRKLKQAVVLNAADVSHSLEANVSKNIFSLEITVGKEMKSTSTKKNFLRVIVFNKQINSICG